MAKYKRKKKRTITPEHLAKMQEGRKNARVRNARLKEISNTSESTVLAKAENDAILLQASMHE